MKEYKNRNEVESIYKFDLTDFYPSIEDWNKSLEHTKKKVEEGKKYACEKFDASNLKEYLDFLFPLRDEIENLYAYAYLSHDTELDNQTYIEMLSDIRTLNNEFEKNNAFFESNIISFEKEDFDNLFHHENLKPYEKYLRKIYKEKGHRRSTEEEKLIATLSETFQSYHSLSSSLINSEHDYGNILLNGKKITISPNIIGYLKQQKEEKVRATVQKKFGRVLKQYQNTESAYLNYYMKNRLNLSKVHNYKNTWEEKLKENEMSSCIFENLVSTAKKHRNAFQNYYRLMKKVLKKKTLHNYDTLLGWGNKDLEYSIESAQNLICEALKPLGKNYQSKLKKVFDCHYIDYCGYKGKINGGYSLSTATHPSRIILTYRGSFTDLLTIAHESGHNVHHQYTQEHNPSWYQEISMYVAEIASLTNEFLVNDYLKKHGTIEERKCGLEHTIKTFQNNFFGAVMEGEMECVMYEHIENGGTLTSDFLNNLAKKQLEYYQGNAVKRDEYAPLMWVTRSHYFLDFYLYSYAICVSIAASLAKQIRENEPNIIEKYEEFLSSGSDITPEEIYQKLGIDVHSSEVFENAIAYFQEQLNEYETYIQKEGGINE